MKEKSADFDLRLPVGALFCFYGVMLAAYGIFEHIELDLNWGGVLLVFGIGLLLATRRGRRAPHR